MNEFINKLIERLEKHVAYNEKMFEMFPNMGEVEKTIYNTQKNSYEETIRIVNQLAEEYNNGWISANDRLPEENGKYIVYYRKWTDGNYLPKFDEKEIRILRYSTNGWSFPTYVDVEAEKDIHREVIAWQPLPPVYQPKGE